MAMYYLAYDLRKEKDYKTLTDELEKFNAKRVLESTWRFEKVNTTSEELRNHFMNFIDSDDGLLVLEHKEMAGYNLLN